MTNEESPTTKECPSGLVVLLLALLIGSGLWTIVAVGGFVSSRVIVVGYALVFFAVGAFSWFGATRNVESGTLREAVYKYQITIWCFIGCMMMLLSLCFLLYP